MVKVKFFGILASYMPETDEEGFWVADHAGSTIRQVAELAGLDKAGIKYSTLVNNARKTGDYVLAEGDVLTVMPMLAGG